jgi:peptide/nickel transport system substrate-binding protein
MNRTGRDLGLWVGMGLLITVSLFNSCQLDQIEARLIDMDLRLAQVERGGGGMAGPSPASVVPKAISEVEGNLLRAPTRPFVTATKVASGQTLRTVIGQDPRGLNPYIATGADVMELMLLVSNQVGRRDISDPDRWVADAAESVTSPDGLTFRVKLREGIWWHLPTVDWASGQYEWLKGEGPGGRHELVADDFLFVFDLLKNEQVSGRVTSLRNYFEQLVSAKEIDRYTFEVVFSEQLYTNTIALMELIPIPRWLYRFDETGKPFDEGTWGLKLNEHWYNNKAIGTGPYSFVSWEPGVRIEWEANPVYFGEAPSFQRVINIVLKDQVAWTRKLKTGELDYTMVQPEQYKSEILNKKPGEYLGNPHVKLGIHDTLGYFFIAWNQDLPQFKDKRVRRALTHALDRVSIVRDHFMDLGEVTSGPFPMQSPCYDPSIAPLPYDLGESKRLLEEAGWTDSDGDGIRDRLIDGKKQDLSFTLLAYGGSTEWDALVGIYREALLSVGVKMTPNAVEWSTMLKKLDEREFDAYTGAWILTWDTDLMQIWHSKEADRPASSNRIGFRSPEGDRIAEALRKTMDEGERVKLCHQFHALVHDEQPYTFIYQRTRAILYWDWMNDLEFTKNWPNRDIRMFSFQEPAGPR